MTPSDARETLRWGGSLLTVLAIHALAIAAALAWSDPARTIAASPLQAVLVDLAPAPVAAPAPPQEIPAGPVQQARPEPVETPVPDVVPDVADPDQDVPRDVAEQPPVERTTTPPMAPLPPAPVPAAAKTRAVGDSDAQATWEGRLLAHLEAHQRYPQRARSNRQQGVVYLRLRIGGNGELLSHALEHGSGHPSLDEEAIAALLRAQPLPPPPPGIGALPVERIVPMQFIYRRR